MDPNGGVEPPGPFEDQQPVAPFAGEQIVPHGDEQPQPVAPNGDEQLVASDDEELVKRVPPTNARKGPVGFYYLPGEILAQIFEYADTNDLFNLASTCNAFHELAAEMLYKSICHTFGDDETVPAQISMNRLLGVMETMHSSDYPYTRHVRTIAFENSRALESGRPRNRRARCGNSCGRFLNTLLVATVNKAINLESFKCDTRLELTPSLFFALKHSLKLRNVHIRLLSGSSLIFIPPAPATAEPSGTLFVGPHPNIPHQHGSPNDLQPDDLEIILSGNGLMAMYYNLYRKLGLSKPSPNFSLLSGLKNLAVLEIGDLGFIPEIAKCISQSSKSVRTLKLSFSRDLALKAQAIPPSIPDVNSNGSNFPFGPSPIDYNYQGQEEHEAQKNALALIFGLDASNFQGKQDGALSAPTEAAPSQDADEGSQEANGDEAQRFARTLRHTIKTLRNIAKVLSRAMRINGEHPQLLMVLERIEVMASRYLTQTGPIVQGSSSEATAAVINNNGPGEGSSSSTQVLPEPNEPNAGDMPVQAFDSLVAELDANGAEPGSSNREVLEALEPDVTREVLANHTSSSGITAQDGEIPSDSKIAKRKESVREARKAAENDLRQFLNNYTDENHGLRLEGLSISLIPVTGIVLCRGIDVTVLKHLSLLDVGRQRPIWTMLRKLQDMHTLELESIHTDEVTKGFLEFVNGLNKVTELFIFERSGTKTIQPSTAKNWVKVDDITRFVLKKHVRHLKRLVVRNDEDSDWVFNHDALVALTSRGRNLVELAIGLEGQGYHFFLQQIGKLRSLKALQVFYFHADPCDNLLQELRTCIIDNMLHYPYMQTEYIAMCRGLNGLQYNSATHLKVKAKTDSKGENTIHDDEGVGIADESDEDRPGPTMDVDISCEFDVTDVPGVKMWEKENWAMKL